MAPPASLPRIPTRKDITLMPSCQIRGSTYDQILNMGNTTYVTMLICSHLALDHLTRVNV